MSRLRKRGSPRIKAYVADCRRCDAKGITIRSSYGLCQTCYHEVQDGTQQEYYPKIWTLEQAEKADAATKGKVWRRTRKILRYAFGMTTIAEWLHVQPIDLYVEDADDHILVAAVRIMGYLGWVISRRAEDEFTDCPIDPAKIEMLVRQAFSTE
jgi:hypothetical protein